MINCVVCRYWSERLEQARSHRNSKRMHEREKRVFAALRAHQRGACACRFPGLLEDLVRRESELPKKASGFCDPLRIRVLAGAMSGVFGQVPTHESPKHFAIEASEGSNGIEWEQPHSRILKEESHANP